MESVRIHRLLRLFTLLQSSRARGAKELTAELGVSRRTLFRDLKALQAAGIPCFHDPQRGYRIAQSFFLPPISLNVAETLSLLLLAQTARTGPLRASALSAINKLITSVPEPIRSTCAQMTAQVSVNVGPQSVAPVAVDHYHLLQRCIDERRACRLSYFSANDQQTLACELEPYALHFSAVAWYVLGRTDLHGEVRIFHLGRIKSLEPADRLFERPRDFSVAQKIGQAWRMIPEGKMYHVELEFSARVASNVTEIRWHASQRQRLLPDGRCLMEFDVDGLGEIAWWICGYADQCVVRKPAALRQRIRGMLASALGAYESDRRLTALLAGMAGSVLAQGKARGGEEL
ncbi:MAG: WYL domain-containing protein [Phycisphaeraceae bacterium]|nr:WYL domain-containing protein [Phycisphaeraceae bacterium]